MELLIQQQMATNRALDIGFTERVKEAKAASEKEQPPPSLVEPVFQSLCAAATVPKFKDPQDEFLDEAMKYVQKYIPTVADSHIMDLLAVLVQYRDLLAHRKLIATAVGRFGYRFKVTSFTQQQWVDNKRIIRVSASIYNNKTVESFIVNHFDTVCEGEVFQEREYLLMNETLRSALFKLIQLRDGTRHFQFLSSAEYTSE
jgi:predicted RNA-binding protein